MPTVVGLRAVYFPHFADALLEGVGVDTASLPGPVVAQVEVDFLLELEHLLKQGLINSLIFELV